MANFREIINNLSRALCTGFVLLSASFSTDAESIDYHGINIPDQAGKVITVTGPTAPSNLGDTITHEHLFLQLWIPLDDKERWERLGRWLNSGTKPPVTKGELELWNMPFSARNRMKLGRVSKDAWELTSVETAIREVQAYQELGGSTIVEVTPLGLKRQPEKVREVARQTGANIIMGTGVYNEPWHPVDMGKWSRQDMTKLMVREIVEGIAGTNIKAGIIGEIPADDLARQPENSDKIRLMRAAVDASWLTGAAISLHGDLKFMHNLHFGLDILEEEGADLSRVVLGHISTVASSDIALLESLLRRGVYLQFDLLGLPSAGMSVTEQHAIKTLIERGYSKQLLVSHDVCNKAQQKEYGGYGFTFVHSVLLPYLRAEGVSESAIDNILKQNPRRVLTFVKPQHLKDIQAQ